ncbi:putative kinase inhibitor [Maioricimonas rarisocia]|uniref:Putative kinase inhibitor n=1 Tax=Maioricimonas rarisocia TaxID=2528026 RepID=A0A517ZE31_9PLAN|nr:YbhB/YbcL family Raf kinase inhibitor-like protein [Maioricimonas rarisocia]QDU40741.1 putative kinase inhibitor [Maioricimonas rarisocia]
MSLSIRSSAFAEGEPVLRRHTGDGEDLSPPLAWEGLPEGTQELVLVCDDPDAPTPQPWVHWLIYGLPADVTELPEGIPAEGEISEPVTARQGKNSWPSGRTVGYRGPAPPPGHGTHHYHFRLYALSEWLGLAAGIDRSALERALQGKVLATTEVVGTYER